MVGDFRPWVMGPRVSHSRLRPLRWRTLRRNLHLGQTVPVALLGHHRLHAQGRTRHALGCPQRRRLNRLGRTVSTEAARHLPVGCFHTSIRVHGHTLALLQVLLTCRTPDVAIRQPDREPSQHLLERHQRPPVTGVFPGLRFRRETPAQRGPPRTSQSRAGTSSRPRSSTYSSRPSQAWAVNSSSPTRSANSPQSGASSYRATGSTSGTSPTGSRPTFKWRSPTTTGT